jgi:UDP-glucose 4-epimerase
VIVVTGGSGFIGTHLCRHLIDAGHSVKIIDIVPPKVRTTFAKIDVQDTDKVSKAIKGADAVVHLAALVDVATSIKDPYSDFSTNVGGTLSVLEAARKAGVHKVVYASSAAVYGEPVKLPISEDHPTVPLSPYGASKLAAERYVLLYNSLYGMENTALRLFNVYGEGQNPVYAGVMTQFRMALARGEHPFIYGDGRQTRDFVHVDDVCQAFMKALKTKGCEVPLNIASGAETSMNGLLEMMSDVLPIYLPNRPGDIECSVADIALAKKRIGFTPKISLSRGLSKC